MVDLRIIPPEEIALLGQANNLLVEMRRQYHPHIRAIELRGNVRMISTAIGRFALTGSAIKTGPVWFRDYAAEDLAHLLLVTEEKFYDILSRSVSSDRWYLIYSPWQHQRPESEEDFQPMVNRYVALFGLAALVYRVELPYIMYLDDDLRVKMLPAYSLHTD